MKIRKSLMLAGMLGAGFVAAPSSAQVYVCMACPAGTYSDGNNTNCAPCPAGTYCPAGTAAPENCQSGMFTFDPKQPCRGADSFATIDSTIANISGSNNTSGTLQPGVYSIVIGGGNGGDTNRSHCATPGGRGAILKYKFIVHAPTNYTLYSGGSGGSSNRGGAGGGAGSAFKLDGVTYVAGGGGGEAGDANAACGGQGGGFGGGGGGGDSCGVEGGNLGGSFGAIYGGGAGGYCNGCKWWGGCSYYDGGNGGGEGGAGGGTSRETSCRRLYNPYGGIGGGFESRWVSGSCSSSYDTNCAPGTESGTVTSVLCPGNGKASHASNTTLGDDCNSCARIYKLK